VAELELSGKHVFAATGGRDFDAARPAIVFLHGSGLDHRFWGQYTGHEAFSAWSVVAPDYPGHGRSAGPPLESIEAIAGWLEALLDELHSERVSLVGHSQGALVALEYAARNPRRVRSLSLIASGAETPVNAALLEAATSDPQAAVAMMTKWSFGPAVAETAATLAGELLAGNSAEALAADLAACNAYAGGRAAAAAVRCPAQVILGGRDRMVLPDAVQALIDSLGDADTQVLPDAGHMLPLEAPDECRALLTDFLSAHNGKGY